MSKLPIDQALHRLMHAYHHALRQCYRTAGLALPLSHIRTLKVIDHLHRQTDSHCTAQAIAARVERDKAQIARVVKELEAEALIERRDNPEDRRSHLLSLTGAGQTTLAAIRQAEQAAGQALTRGLNQDQLNTFIQLSQTMTQNLLPSGEEPATSNYPSPEAP